MQIKIFALTCFLFFIFFPDVSSEPADDQINYDREHLAYRLNSFGQCPMIIFKWDKLMSQSFVFKNFGFIVTDCS